MISTIGKKLVNLQGLPYMPPNLVNFGPETSGNGWSVFAHPQNFLHYETLSALPHGRYITDSRQTLARVMWWLEQRNAGNLSIYRDSPTSPKAAQARLCHASSFVCWYGLDGDGVSPVCEVCRIPVQSLAWEDTPPDERMNERLV